MVAEGSDRATVAGVCALVGLAGMFLVPAALAPSILVLAFFAAVFLVLVLPEITAVRRDRRSRSDFRLRSSTFRKSNFPGD